MLGLPKRLFEYHLNLKLSLEGLFKCNTMKRNHLTFTNLP